MRVDILPRFHLCMPFFEGSLCLQTVFLGGHSLLHLSVRVKGILFLVIFLLNSMCVRAGTYNVLSARRAYRLRDINHEIDAHIICLAGTRLWDGSAHRSAVAHHGRHFERRWGGVRADEMLNHVCRSVKSHSQETMEAKPRGEDVPRASETAGERARAVRLRN